MTTRDDPARPSLLGEIWPAVVGVVFAMIGLTLVAPILPLYAREFGVSRTSAGVLVAAFAVSRIVFDLGGGVLLDRIPSRTMMRAGGVLIAVSSVAAALAGSFGILVVARLIEGAGSAAYAVASQTWLIRKAPPEQLGRAMAWYHTGLTLGVVVGPLVGGFAAEIGDFTTPFWLYAVLGLAVLALTGRMSGSQRKPAVSASPPSLRFLLRRPAFLAIMYVGFALFVMRLGARSTLLPLFAREEVGLGEVEIGLVIAVSGVVNLALVYTAGHVVDRYDKGVVLGLGMLVTAASIAAYGYVGSLAGLIWVSLLFGVGTSFGSVAAPTIAAGLAEEGGEGTAMGLYRAAGDAGAIVGPVALGAVADGAGFVEGFWATAVILVSAAGLAMGMRSLRSIRPAGRHADPGPG